MSNGELVSKMISDEKRVKRGIEILAVYSALTTLVIGISMSFLS